MALFGGWTLVMDIAMQRATFNRCPISPLPYSHDAQSWLYSQMQKREIPIEELVQASLIVGYLVEMGRRSGMPYPTAKVDFSCAGAIASPDRLYIRLH
jgi:hypothetical protein